jgi:hypothetical protein
MASLQIQHLPLPLQRLYFAITEGGGSYPIKASRHSRPAPLANRAKGIYYFATHRFLWPLVRARLLPCFLLSIFVLALLFTFTYLPQVAWLALFHRRGSAWFNGTVLVLGESSIVTAGLFEAWFVDEAQVDVFDAVLVAEGQDRLVAGSREVLPDEPGLDPRTRLGKPTKPAVYAPFSIRQIVELVLLLPLNLLPYVGVPLFLLFTGYRAGPLLQWRYHQLKGMNKKERRAFVKRRQWMYTWYVAPEWSISNLQQVRHGIYDSGVPAPTEYAVPIYNGCWVRTLGGEIRRGGPGGSA